MAKYATDAERLEYLPSPSVETRSFHPNDDRLRTWGFEILERRGDSPAIWRKRIRGRWVRFTQEMAERYAANRKGGLET